MTTFNAVTGQAMQESPMVRKVEEFIRPADATQYAAGDSVAIAQRVINAATNASPIVCTTTAAHLLTTGDRVFVDAVGGNTNANGIRRVTVLSATTFSLQNEETGAAIAGNAAYTSGGTVQRLPRLADVVPVNGGSGSIVAVRLWVRNPTVTTGTFRVRFYNKPIAAIADNAAQTVLAANRTLHQGYVDLTILTIDGAGGDSSTVLALLAQPLPFVCDPNRADLFPVITALGAFTPASGDIFRLTVDIKREQVPALSGISRLS